MDVGVRVTGRRVLRPDVPVGRGASVPVGRLLGTLVLCLLLGAVVVLVAGLLISEGGFTGVALGVVLGSLALTGMGFLAMLLAHPRKGRLDVVTDEGRLWLPAARPIRPLSWAGLGLSVALGAVVVVGVVIDGEFRASNLASFGAIVVAVAALPALIATMRGTSAPPRVGLGPDDVIRESGRGYQVIAWTDVVGVDLVADPGPRVLVTARVAVPTRYRSRPSVGERPATGPRTRPDQLPIPTNLHGSDPRLVELLLRHYLRHPAHRIELGTPAAEERIARGDLSA